MKINKKEAGISPLFKNILYYDITDVGACKIYIISNMSFKFNLPGINVGHVTDVIDGRRLDDQANDEKKRERN